MNYLINRTVSLLIGQSREFDSSKYSFFILASEVKYVRPRVSKTQPSIDEV